MRALWFALLLFASSVVGQIPVGGPGTGGGVVGNHGAQFQWAGGMGGMPAAQLTPGVAGGVGSMGVGFGVYGGAAGQNLISAGMKLGAGMGAGQAGPSLKDRGRHQGMLRAKATATRRTA